MRSGCSERGGSGPSASSAAFETGVGSAPAPDDVAQLRAALLERRAAMHERSLADAAELDLVRDARADSADDEHDPEGSTLTSDWSRIAGLHDATRKGLVAVDRALQRIVDGAYGDCLRCGRPIAADRLRARPEAEHCIDCARELS